MHVPNGLYYIATSYSTQLLGHYTLCEYSSNRIRPRGGVVVKGGPQRAASERATLATKWVLMSV